MTDLGKCAVCNTRPAIGVASTSIPMSVPFCKECAQAGADPESVFEFWKEEGIDPENHRCPDDSKTWKDGKFITYREWYVAQAVQS